MELNSKYIMTDAGLIPEDWKSVTLKDVCTFFNGLAHENIVSKNGAFKLVNSKFISTEGKTFKRVTENIQPLSEGDIVLVMSDIPNGKALAKTYIIEENGTYTLNQRIGGIRPKYCVGEFLFYALNRNKYFLSYDSGTGQTNLRKDEVLACPIALPESEGEQLKISGALTRINKLIYGCEKLIVKKKNIMQGLIQGLATGQERLAGFHNDWDGEYKKSDVGKIPSDWVVVTLKDILKIKHGRSQKEVQSQNGEFPIYATGGIIGYATEPLFSKPSVCIGRKGTIDKPRYVEEPFWSVDTLFFTDVFGASAKFIYYKFLLINWYDYNEASGVPSLSGKTIESIQVSLPPSLLEQEEICKKIDSCDDEIKLLEKKLIKFKEMKVGMSQVLLTGKVRLV